MSTPGRDPSMDATRRSRSWPRRIGLGLVGILGSLGMAEVLARALTGPPPINAYQVLDAELGFRHVPSRKQCWDARGVFELATNSSGFRGPELPPEGAPKTRPRVLLLGDSFVHAWQVRAEEWVGSVLGAELARAGAPADVYALCADDWGTAQELLALRQHGRRVQPDVVVLLLYPGNDLVNNTPALAGRTPGSPGDYFRPYLLPDGAGGLERRYALPWRARLRRSRLFGWLEQRWLAGRSAAELRAELAGGEVGEGDEASRELYLEPLPGDPWDAAWHTTEALVLATRAEAELLGARLVAVVLPSREQVERGVAAAMSAAKRRAGGRERREGDVERPEQRLEELFHRAGLAHLSLLGPLRARAAERRASVYLKNGHLDGDAHGLLGRALAARLAPGAGDGCFQAGGEPVDVLALLGEPPLALDFTRAEHVCLFGPGWDEWYPPGRNPGLTGWVLEGEGHFVARAGFVTLQGLLTEGAAFPATVSVALHASPRVPLAREGLAAPGPFTLRFELPASPGSPWIPLRLRLPSARARSGVPFLVLQHLGIDATRPGDWPPAAPPLEAGGR